MAQERRAKERRKKELQRKISRIIVIVLPLIAVIALIIAIIVTSGSSNSSSGSDNTTTESDSGTEDSTETNSDTDTSDTDDSADDASYSTDISLTIEDGDTVNIDYVGSIDGVEFDGGRERAGDGLGAVKATGVVFGSLSLTGVDDELGRIDLLHRCLLGHGVPAYGTRDGACNHRELHGCLIFIYRANVQGLR